jgi:hypothetical protein
MLPTNVMDEAMRLHDDCLRAHLAAYQGYESASEGRGLQKLTQLSSRDACERIT